MKWEPIETAPNEKRIVMAYFGSSEMQEFAAIGYFFQWPTMPKRLPAGWPLRTEQPTHWMPLPESPDEPRYTITEAGRAMLRDAQQSSPDRQQGE